MKDQMAAYRSQISSVVVSSVIDTFNMMLRQNVTAMAVRTPRAPGPDTGVYACVRLDQKNLTADFYFSFDRSLLLLTAAAFYEAEKGKQPDIHEDIACAVANIVGGKVKTFLNRQGYAFEMGIPFVAKPGVSGTEDAIHVHFSYDRSGDNGLVVNYQMEEKKAGSSST
jgi:CheY-specific phosphatase CheX